MRHRTRSNLALAFAVLVSWALLLPAAPAADAGLRIETKGKKLGHPMISTVPVDLGNGYSLTLTSFPKGMQVIISKGTENDGEFYYWVFAGMNNPVKVNKKMSSVSVNGTFETNEEVGASGSISMISNREKPEGPGGMHGCDGVNFEQRDGTLTGSFVFDTGTELFGVIERDSFELDYARRSVGKSRCMDPPVCNENYSVSFSFPEGMLWTAELEDGSQLLVADVRKYFDSGFFAQLLRETNPASSLQAASDLSSATLTGNGNISGTATYVADTPKESFNMGYGCGTEYRTRGYYSGDMTFTYDLGVVDPFANGPAYGMLLER